MGIPKEYLLERKVEYIWKWSEGMEKWLEGKMKPKVGKKKDNRIDGDGSCIAEQTKQDKKKVSKTNTKRVIVKNSMMRLIEHIRWKKDKKI